MLMAQMEKSAWWFKFQIDVDHPWHGKRYKKLGHVLNYISKMSAYRRSFTCFTAAVYEW